MKEEPLAPPPKKVQAGEGHRCGGEESSSAAPAGAPVEGAGEQACIRTGPGLTLWPWLT